MPLMEKRAVHIHASIKVSIRFIVAHGTHEELSPLAPQREQYWLVPWGLTSTVQIPAAQAFSRAC